MNIPGVNNGGVTARQSVMNNSQNKNGQAGVMPEQPADQATPADTYLPSPLATNRTQSTLPEPIASADSPVGQLKTGEQATDMAEIKRQDRLYDQATQNNMVENMRNAREGNQGSGRLLDMIV